MQALSLRIRRGGEALYGHSESRGRPKGGKEVEVDKWDTEVCGLALSFAALKARETLDVN